MQTNIGKIAVLTLLAVASTTAAAFGQTAPPAPTWEDPPYGTGGETGSTGNIAFVLGNMNSAVEYVTLRSKRNGQAAQQWNCIVRSGNDWYQITGRDRGWRHRIGARAAVPYGGACLNGPWITAIGAAIPNPPMNATASPGATTVTLGWTKPSGHNETSWQLGYSTDTSDTEPSTMVAGFTTSSSQIITGLTVDTEYKLFVRSVVLNADQDEILPGAKSSWLTTTTTTTSTLPTITDVEGTGDGNDSSAQGTLRVTIDSTTIPSGTTHIRLRPRQSNNNFDNVFPAVNTNHVYDIANRVRGYRYEVQAAACTGPSVANCGSLGTGVWGALRPGPPTTLSTPTIQSNSITLAWTGPTGYPDGFFETGYNTNTSATEPQPETIGSFTQTLQREITGLSPNTEYRLFVRTTINHANDILGDAVSVWKHINKTTSVPPLAAPTNLTLTPGNQQIHAEWTAPTGTVTGYDVEYRTPIGEWTDAGHTGTDTEHTITGLENDEAHEVRVRAKNDNGAGLWSIVEKEIPFEEGPPAKPRDLTLSPGDGDITATWLPPGDDGGSAITGYTIRYKARSASDWTEWEREAEPTEAIIKNLTNGTEYEVGLKATNTHGDSLWTATERSTPGDGPTPGPGPDPEPEAPPNRPRNLSLTAYNGALGASWDAPDGGTAVDAYNVLHRARGQQWNDPIDAGSSTSYTITGLTNGTEYIVRITARNDAGESRPSLPERETPSTSGGSPPSNPNPNPGPEPPDGATAPGRPQNLTLTPGNGQFTASWNAPESDGGSAITSYTIHYRRQGQEFEDEPAGTGTSHTVSGLNNNARYIVRVSATNAVGTGRPSLPANTTPQAHLRNAAPPATTSASAERESNVQPVPALPVWAIGALMALLFGRALRLRRR